MRNEGCMRSPRCSEKPRLQPNCRAFRVSCGVPRLDSIRKFLRAMHCGRKEITRRSQVSRRRMMSRTVGGSADCCVSEPFEACVLEFDTQTIQSTMKGIMWGDRYGLRFEGAVLYTNLCIRVPTVRG